MYYTYLLSVIIAMIVGFGLVSFVCVFFLTVANLLVVGLVILCLYVLLFISFFSIFNCWVHLAEICL